jgi:hypothetical protein
MARWKDATKIVVDIIKNEAPIDEVRYRTKATVARYG